MTKHQQYFQDMVESHKELFDKFGKIHSKYNAQPKQFQDEFNEKGQEVLQIIRRYENMLCSQSEGGKYGKFSANLSDKFWAVIRGAYPKIDFVGVRVG